MTTERVEKIGYLWEHKTNGGDTLFKGYIDMGLLGKFNVKILKNKHKYKETQPDYDVISSGKQIAKTTKD